MKKLAAMTLALCALGTMAMADGFSLSFGYSDCGPRYYGNSYYGYSTPVVVYPYRYCAPTYRSYPYYSPYTYRYSSPYRYDYRYSHRSHHGSGHHRSSHHGRRH